MVALQAYIHSTLSPSPQMYVLRMPFKNLLRVIMPSQFRPSYACCAPKKVQLCFFKATKSPVMLLYAPFKTAQFC